MASWRRLPAVVWLLLLLGIPGVVRAQTFRGGIAGRVADSTGAVLPGGDGDRDQRRHRPLAHHDDLDRRRLFGARSAAGHLHHRSDASGLSDAAHQGRGHRLADCVGGTEDGAVAGRRDDQRHRVDAPARHGIDRAEQRGPPQAGARPPAQRERLPRHAAARARRRRHLGERRADARQQFPDRRRRQQRRVPEHGGGQPGRRLGHRRHAAADRGDRPVLDPVGRPGRNGPQRRLHREPCHQVGHQRLSRQHLLLQPERAPVGQFAGGGARLAEAGDPQQPVRLLARRTHRPQQDVFLFDPRGPEADCGQHHPDHHAVGGLGGVGDAAARSVRRAGEPGLDQHAGALALEQPHRRRGRVEFREHGRQYLQQRQRHRQGRLQFQPGPQPVGALLRRRRRSGRADQLAVPGVFPGGAEPDAQRVAGRHQRVHLAFRQSAGGRLQLFQADLQLERHLVRPDRVGLQHRGDRSDAGRAAQRDDQRVRGGGRHAAAGARRQDAALHRQHVVFRRRASDEVRRRSAHGRPVHLLRQQQARHLHLRRHGRPVGGAAGVAGERLAEVAGRLHGRQLRDRDHRAGQHPP